VVEGRVMRVEVSRAARSERSTLENLLQLYLHDFSEILGIVPSDDGRFDYPRLPLYWTESGRTPFLFRAEGQLAGFALVSRGSVVSGDSKVLDMAEFFVVRGLRRRGVGRAAAISVFGLFEGSWEVRVLDQNRGARAFWEDTISSFTAGKFDVERWESKLEMEWHVFRFSGGRAGND
jgi:predicted acetyltransferase